MTHHDLGNGCHAWLPPDGGWGWSNAGLVVGAGESLLVDTLFDVRLTQRMLDGLAAVTAKAPITTVVNTHGNGDHWFGNQLLAHAEIVASNASVADMRRVGPAEVLGLLGHPGPAGRFTKEVFGAFDFAEVVPTYPNRTFDSALTLSVGGVDVHLVDVGPAHTAGDTIVHVPSARTVFTGDIVFAGGTPVVWDGPVENWLRACDLLLALDVDTVVPGHGPVTDHDGVRVLADYLRFVHHEASTRHAAGLAVDDAVRDIDLGPYAALAERERLAANVRAVYRELDPAIPPPDGPELFGCMGAFKEERR